MNQQVICEHLAKVGLKSVVANNGKEGTDFVSSRERNGEKPFDLIFMDIHMPVMGGLEAASKISSMGIETPIVALTANIMGSEMELYKENGMPDCLSKPFTSQELWRCLLRYFQPVSVSFIDEQRQAEDDKKFMKQLKNNFVINNKTTFDEIKKAADDGDIALAYRLAHTLKSNAGQIGEKQLQKAAADVEDMLKDGKNTLTEAKTVILETELKVVLSKLAPLFAEQSAEREIKSLSGKELFKLLEKLEAMLKNRNPECINMIGDLRAIPGSEELIRQIEDFEFKKAIAAFSIFKERMDSEV